MDNPQEGNNITFMLTPLKLVFHRSGIFDAYSIFGHLYLTQDTLEAAWHITASLQGGEISRYWVVGDDFHAVTMHYAYKMTSETCVAVHDVIGNVSDIERKVVSHAIQQWSGEYHYQLLSQQQ